MEAAAEADLQGHLPHVQALRAAQHSAEQRHLAGARQAAPVVQVQGGQVPGPRTGRLGCGVLVIAAAQGISLSPTAEDSL